ncbi:bacterio-opsin activator domain-containing protein [Halobaculum marinum]|uniref:Bacterio-opsin activator domain-containing protein n=1 Tax=Halobaculum marinum TaxID=3031996 RepID=A0ABD5WYL5_9EURY|nr:bacterio-opsin activator domain-containing protein [Halobaculum sp. DT55]
MGDEGSGAVPSAAVRAVFERAAPGEPLTSTEVATELDCARTTAYKKLQRLAADGDLETKKVGARGRVWWLPVDAAEPTQRDSDVALDDAPEYEAVVASERKYRAVFERAFDAILIADDEGRYVDVNPAACDLFGLPREELLGTRATDYAEEGYDVASAWQDFQQSDLDRGLFPLVRPDGERRLLEFAATPDILPGLHLSVLRDVTERREVRSELERERARRARYQRSLTADAVVEVTVRIEGEALFGALSDGLDCRCEFEGVVPTSDGRLLHYLTVTGATGAEVAVAVDSSPSVDDCRIVFEEDDAVLVELDVTTSPVRTLFEAGANARSMVAEDGVVTVVAEIGADAEFQRLINGLRAAYPDTTVVAKRTLDRPIVTTRQYRDSLADALTERQRETLRAAYLAGYFEWPRTSSAEDLADSMGIASSTWLRHLRRAEAKLVVWFFEELEA